MQPEIYSTSSEEIDGALTVKEFCQTYKIGHTAVYSEIGAGRLTAKKRGTRTLIPKASARQWFENLPSLKAGNASTAA